MLYWQEQQQHSCLGDLQPLLQYCIRVVCFRPWYTGDTHAFNRGFQDPGYRRMKLCFFFNFFFKKKEEIIFWQEDHGL